MRWKGLTDIIRTEQADCVALFFITSNELRFTYQHHSQLPQVSKWAIFAAVALTNIPASLELVGQPPRSGAYLIVVPRRDVNGSRHTEFNITWTRTSS